MSHRKQKTPAGPEARDRGKTRMRTIAVSATAASLIAAGGLALELPGPHAHATTSSASQGSSGSSGSSSSGTSGSSGSSATSGSAGSGQSSSSSGLQSPNSAPASSSGTGQVTTGGS